MAVPLVRGKKNQLGIRHGRKILVWGKIGLGGPKLAAGGPRLVAKFGLARTSFGKMGPFFATKCGLGGEPFLAAKIGPGDYF